jgi:ankyrin repeat protein
MAYQVASSCDFCGLPWSGYVCCEGLQPSQPKDNDIETDVSQHYYPYCESFASSSSFLDLSLSRSAELTSASSSASEVDFTDFMKQKTGDFRAMDPSTSRSGLMAAETTTHSDVNGYVDPRLVVSGLPSCNNPNTSDHMGNATLGGNPVQSFYNDFRPPLVDQVSSLRYPTNDFDIALSEVQSTIHTFKPGLNLWLRTWVATNPQKFPNNQELESLRTLSGLSEAEIVTCLSEHVPTQVASAAEAMDTELTTRDAEQTSCQKRPPRYRPKCRRSRRRFRYVAETQDERRIFECTHQCGQSFARKGQWTRHERSNVEEWKCDRCDFVSARKDKLRSHLTEVHSLRGGPRKSHCRQLLQPSARRCGFCLDRFENWSAWLNHISAHFEGHIAGGPWTMAKWNRAVDPDFGSSESDDDDDDDNDDDDDDQAGNEEDQDDPDYGNSATDQTGNSSNKGKDASYGSGSKGSSRSSSKSKSKSSGSRSSKSHRGASRALSYLQQDYYTSQSDHGCKLVRSHTMSPLKPRKADLVPLGGEGNRGFLRYRKPDRPVVQSSQTCSPKDSSGVEMESVSSILPPHERERRQDQPLRLSAVNSNIGYGDAMSGVSPLPKALVMQWAAENGHEAVVKLPLEKGADMESKDTGYSRAPPSWAAVVKLSLENGANMESKDKDKGYGRMLLSWAAADGHEALVKPLPEKSANVESKDTEYGQMPLSLAAMRGQEAVMKPLLQMGPDVESKSSYGRTPLSLAAERGREAVVEPLLQKEPDTESKSRNGRTPLSRAVEYRREAVVKLLLEKGADVRSKSRNGRTPLSWASEYGREAVAKLLLEKSLDVESKSRNSWTLLSWAAANGREAVVKLLLEKGVDVESKGTENERTPLSWAAENGREAVVKLLLEKGADMESTDKEHGRMPLSWAAENGREAVVRLLLEKGADVDSKSRNGRTPLSWAAEKGHKAVVELLLRKGADVESEDTENDRTPLSLAAENGREVVVKQLLEKSADVDSKSRNGRTPLSWAAEKGHKAVVKLLLRKGADVESEGAENGRTPLSLAAENGHKAVVELLIKKGADVESKSRNGRTPLSWAAKKGHEAVVKLLLQEGADMGSKDTEYGRMPLSWAAANRCEVVVKSYNG